MGHARRAAAELGGGSAPDPERLSVDGYRRRAGPLRRSAFHRLQHTQHARVSTEQGRGARRRNRRQPLGRNRGRPAPKERGRLHGVWRHRWAA
ncbi:MAG: hypothetical protein NEA02_18510 [Thermoanaerobaculia bacterium]|nr:hypothetical protein [Thermoanaerobaculia bacterium]